MFQLIVWLLVGLVALLVGVVIGTVMVATRLAAGCLGLDLNWVWSFLIPYAGLAGYDWFSQIKYNRQVGTTARPPLEDLKISLGSPLVLAILVGFALLLELIKVIDWALEEGRRVATGWLTMGAFAALMGRASQLPHAALAAGLLALAFILYTVVEELAPQFKIGRPGASSICDAVGWGLLSPLLGIVVVVDETLRWAQAHQSRQNLALTVSAAILVLCLCPWVLLQIVAVIWLAFVAIVGFIEATPHWWPPFTEFDDEPVELAPGLAF